MANQIQFELASPHKMAVKKPVVMASVPGSMGRFGVLTGHAPVASEVMAGIVELYENDNSTVTDRFFVTGGFCEVIEDRCTVMADKVYRLEDLNRAEIEETIKDLLAQADAAEGDEVRETIRGLIDIERAKLFAAA